VMLPEGRWRNRLTGADVEGGTISVKSLLKDFPVALLVRNGAGSGRNDA
jgi:(1->4)-alpha-D-glucan 1-alpha-D-glucosylmutase